MVMTIFNHLLQLFKHDKHLSSSTSIVIRQDLTHSLYMYISQLQLTHSRGTFAPLWSTYAHFEQINQIENLYTAPN